MMRAMGYAKTSVVRVQPESPMVTALRNASSKGHIPHATEHALLPALNVMPNWRKIARPRAVGFWEAIDCFPQCFTVGTKYVSAGVLSIRVVAGCSELIRAE